MKRKYLVYDDLVRGAGLGHSLCSYSYGLDLARQKGLIYVPALMHGGHGAGRNGFSERLLGLPNLKEKRSNLLTDHDGSAVHIKYNKNKQQPTLDFTTYKNTFLNYFSKSLLATDPEPLNSPLSISITIRRGDVAITYDKHHPFRTRLRPTSFYLNVLDTLVSQLQLKNFHVYIFTDSRHSYSVDEFGNKQDFYEIFSKYRGKCSVEVGELSQSALKRALSICINSNIFIGSISGFSDAICMYRRNKECYLPVYNINKKNEFYQL